MGSPGSTDTASAAPAAARPRVEGDREREILAGAIAVLLETGYDRLTFDAVAAQVRASKATLYRRWKSKADLVVAAVEAQACSDGVAELPDSGCLKTDLLAIFCPSPEEEPTELSEVMAAVLPALHRDSEFTRLFTEKFIAPRMQGLRIVLERAQRRGEVGKGADLDLLASILPALKFHHIVVRGQCPTAAGLHQIIDQVLLPACAAGRDRSAVGADA
ncbi:TetR/AcrR family transcriptional regulator [Allobranchiibius sp. CTAmp26]|uniref:TetR/AcrR family transcriptional regulator n=1 Tax=Allobranchiibius sp. CTAmp26 TaxID=2815214 RepID=UPI001AA0D798|nr:TetR/AcrR family transcriptional regulator [Allobranchiibius sp. CTAmp26]MBO1755563.1 TetR/AcrR family transcriptional regulator [Allobranchiibius sp. CTAmp26]